MYRNTRRNCIIYVANIIWRSGHAIGSSFLVWSWVCLRRFPTSIIAKSTAMDTMVTTMVTKLFRRHLVRQLIASDTCLPLVSDGCSQGHSRSAWTWSTKIVYFSLRPYPYLCHECRIYFVFIVNFSDSMAVFMLETLKLSKTLMSSFET